MPLCGEKELCLYIHKLHEISVLILSKDHYHIDKDDDDDDDDDDDNDDDDDDDVKATLDK
jgi:hypothetical protein